MKVDLQINGKSYRSISASDNIKIKHEAGTTKLNGKEIKPLVDLEINFGGSYEYYSDEFKSELTEILLNMGYQTTINYRPHGQGGSIFINDELTNSGEQWEEVMQIIKTAESESDARGV